MPPPRPRGAQPGNANALKHGFYARRFTRRDLSGVEDINMKSLAEEIALIRVLTRRLVEACGPSADLYDLAGVLRSVCLASATITRVIKSHAFLSSKHAEYEDAIDEALREIAEEFHLFDPPPASPDPDAPSQPQSRSDESG